MSRISAFLGILFTLLFFWNSFQGDDADHFSERAKIAIREVGNQNLLANGDHTSLVLPVIELENQVFELAFQQELALNPDSLLPIIKRTFQKAGLPEAYILEVSKCSDAEVAYSFEMSSEENNTIIPCRGRVLPNACYTIQGQFREWPKKAIR